MPLKKIESILASIAADDLDMVYVYVTTRAAEWMVAGFASEANALLETLWGVGLAHSGNVWTLDQGFQILWETSGMQPKGIPFTYSDGAKIIEKNWGKLIADPRPVGCEKPEEGSAFYDLTESISRTPWLQDIANHQRGAQRLSDCLNELLRLLARPEAGGYSYYEMASCGALLAARGGKADYVSQFLELWGSGYMKWPYNFDLSTLLSEPTLVPFLLKGTLAEVFKLNAITCIHEWKQITAGLDQRVKLGRKLAFGKLGWSALLKRLGEEAFRQTDFDFAPALLASRSLLKPAATKKAIRDAAIRLGVTLPDDYREFLLASNGLHQYATTAATLSPVEEIGFFRDLDPQMVEIWNDAMAEADPVFAEKLTTSILIGGLGEEQQVLLIPLPGEGRFECWLFANWLAGAEEFAGFRYYMERELQQLVDNAAE